MGLPTAFSSKTKLWFRSKFPYESSFALLQLRHWLFCFDEEIHGTDIAWDMVIMYTSPQHLLHYLPDHRLLRVISENKSARSESA